VVHVLDASRAVPIATSLLSDEGKSAFVEQYRAEYEAIRNSHDAPQVTAIPIEQARTRKTSIEWRADDIPTPVFTGVRTIDSFPLKTLREYIDWSFFFHVWGLKGVFPRILEHEEYGEQARQLYTDGNTLLDRMVRENLLTARGVYGFFPANAVGDDIEIYTDTTRRQIATTFHFLRQQVTSQDDRPCRSLADFIAPKETGLADYLGAFAVTSGFGLKELCDRFRAGQDEYSVILAQALADRLAEAFAEYLHQQARRDWGYGKEEQLSSKDLLLGKYRGIRPAAGYPACPDHSEKDILWKLLDVEKNTGMKITESYAMWPGSSVSGLYFAHPESRYFSLGKIARDQVVDYQARKGMPLEEVERWLSPNLNYVPSY
jgi:5-methyltetrahydrofolate--homocysteine methyltransferase